LFNDPQAYREGDKIMQYMLLIYTQEAREAQRTPAERQANLAQYMAFARAATEAGIMRAGDEIAPTVAAKTVRRIAGRLHTSDGPFAETKEQLGGFFILECATMDEALTWATRLPAVDDGCVEVRPIVDHSQ
jgi:hypothetical protein